MYEVVDAECTIDSTEASMASRRECSMVKDKTADLATRARREREVFAEAEERLDAIEELVATRPEEVKS